MKRRYDVCIIGGGAAGLAAAASIDRKIRTCILEKNEILGRKILATGGGRCNLTNAGCQGHVATLDFFASHGLQTYCDKEGRYYPYSGCASDVVRTLEDAVREAGVDVFTGCAAESVERAGAGSGSPAARFQIHPAAGSTASDANGAIEADIVLLAAGGKAAPQFGTIGDGYRMARSLGHTVSRVYPILTGIECGDLSDLHGIRARAEVTLRKDGHDIASERGEVQLLRDGVSGICVFNLTPHIRAQEGESPAAAMRRYELVLDLAPDFTREQIESRIEAGRSAFGIVNAQLAERVSLTQIKAWHLPVLGVKGWKHAQCTAGGVLLKEVDLQTMGSRLVPGLYFAGELLDIQGPCGGYNLQNAWETGMRAAAAINAAHEKRNESGAAGGI